MTETSNTTDRRREAVMATWPIGLYAVAGHGLDRGLPGPLEIRAPRLTDDRPAVLVSVESSALDAWVDSIEVTSSQVAPSSVAGYEHVSVVGLLPDTGVRVRLLAARRVATPVLSVVPA